VSPVRNVLLWRSLHGEMSACVYIHLGERWRKNCELEASFHVEFCNNMRWWGFGMCSCSVKLTVAVWRCWGLLSAAFGSMYVTSGQLKVGNWNWQNSRPQIHKCTVVLPAKYHMSIKKCGKTVLICGAERSGDKWLATSKLTDWLNKKKTDQLTNKQTNKQTDIRTDRQIDKLTDRETNKLTD
jgi:hypothetical protein